jgi:hypothetical protein
MVSPPLPWARAALPLDEAADADDGAFPTAVTPEQLIRAADLDSRASLLRHEIQDRLVLRVLLPLSVVSSQQ